MNRFFVVALAGTSFCYCRFLSATPLNKTNISKKPVVAQKPTALKKAVVKKAVTSRLPAPARAPKPKALVEAPTESSDDTSTKEKRVLIGTFDLSLLGKDADTQQDALRILIDQARKRGLTAICPRDSLMWSSAGSKTVDLDSFLTPLKQVAQGPTVAPTTVDFGGRNLPPSDPALLALTSLEDLGTMSNTVPSKTMFLDSEASTKGLVNSALANMPDGDLKSRLTDAMTAFAAAAMLWENGDIYNDVSEYLKADEPIFKKYNLSVPSPNPQANFSDWRYGTSNRYTYVLKPKSDLLYVARRTVIESRKIMEAK